MEAARRRACGRGRGGTSLANGHRARATPPNTQKRHTPLSPLQIISHLRSYIQPTYQRYIVRIVFTVPVFAVTSFFSLLFGQAAVYFEAVRGW